MVTTGKGIPLHFGPVGGVRGADKADWRIIFGRGRILCIYIAARGTASVIAGSVSNVP